MLISWREGLFIARCTIREAKILHTWGWIYDPAIRRWITDSADMAAKWPEALAPSAAAAIDIDRRRRQRVVALSYATDAPGFEVPLSEVCQERGWDYHGFQKANVKYGVRRDRVLIADSPGLGKGQVLSAKVRVSGGWKTIGDLSVGDGLCGYDGRGGRVTGVYDRGIMDVYEVEFSDGAKTRVSYDHLWRVRSSLAGEWFVSPTWEIADRMSRGQRIRIPMADPMGGTGTGRSVVINPYLVGLLLGDGGLTNNTVNISSGDDEIVQFCKDVAGDYRCELKHRSKFDYSFRKIDRRNNELKARLVKIGIFGKGSRDKFIPDCYLFNSPGIRLSILRGIMDADGWISHGVTGFCSTSKRLCDDVAELVMSLGGNARKTTKHNKFGPLYNLTINMSVCPFILSRKADKWLPNEKYIPYRLFKSIKLVGQEHIRCISVSCADKLYITDDYIVTHNTISAIGRSNYHDSQRNLVISLAAHRVNWRREIETWAASTDPDVNVISPENLSFDPEYPWTVISYNYAKDFYRQLVEVEFDHIIVDEAHMLRGANTNRTTHILGGGSGRDFKPALGGRRWSFLTGTPVDHRPADLWTLARFCDPKGLGAREDHYLTRYCGGHVNAYAKISAARGRGNLEELQFRARSTFMTRREKGDVLKDLPPKQRQVILVPQSRLKAKTEKERSTVASALDAFVGLQEALYEDIADKASAFTDYVNDNTELSELDGSFEDVLGQLGNFQVAEIAEVIATARRELAEAKVPIVVEHVRSLIESGSKVLVFGYHRSVVKAIKAELAEYGLADFSVSTMRRQDQVDLFQNNEDCRVGVGNILAAGIGYTLTAADLVVFPELSWSQSDMAQAEDRAHRIGLEHSLLIHYLIVEGSLDSYMVERIIAKMIMAERSLSKERLTAR